MQFTVRFSFIFFLLLIIWGCSTSSTEIPNHTVFRYNEHANITSLDPAFAKDQRNIWACHQIYNTLVQLDQNLDVKADAAKSWVISEDGLTYTFQLRSDIYFHSHKVFGKDSTRLLNAADVSYSLNRLTNPEVASPGSWVLQKVKQIKAIDEFVVQIKLKTAFPAFLSLLSMQYASIIPVEMEQLDFRTSPIGSGPFYMKRWIDNEKLVLRKNPLYFETDKNGVQLPYLKAVAITFLPDKQSEFMQFAQGNLDFLSGLDASYKDELLSPNGQLNAKYENRLQMQKSPYLNTEYLGIFKEGKNSALQSKKFRQAINFGINRKDMIAYLRNNIGVPGENGFIPKGLPGFTNHKKYTYQPELAKQLIQEFKQESGIKKPSITLATNASYLDLVEFVQKELQQLGVDVAIDVMPPSTLLQQRSAGQLPVFRSSWIADYPDAENYLSLFYSRNFSPNGPNYTHFKNATFDSLYIKSLAISETKKRTHMYQKMDSILIEEAPFVVLYYDEVVRFTHKNIQGLGINPLNLLKLKEVQKTE
ncbi:ABC transporter substrate-binding protein [Psychroflexus salis]|uniref:Peptide ABC transporter substrate-binding protein n=1 Tax=Psychroflexus salis TaxID=1526574 RepID=A0A917A1B6_9FLAO|nr:ABC transporter substrate-binding protein [Psychroflexus salis]GGE22008.1 peptide ABC transporter substrate-binding protein [Psychroflexus salis]